MEEGYRMAEVLMAVVSVAECRTLVEAGYSLHVMG